MEEKNIANLEKYLPKGYNWKWSPAQREKQLGRAIAGMAVGVREGNDVTEEWEHKINCLTGFKIKIGEMECQVAAVYNRTGVCAIQKTLGPKLEKQMGENTIVVGDWNARTGKLGGAQKPKEVESETEPIASNRNSTDPIVDKEGVALIEFLEDYGLSIINGNVEGDWDGLATHTDYRSNSVIDYVACNNEMARQIIEMKIGNQIHSDHFPLEVTLRTNAGPVQQQEEKESYSFSETAMTKFNRKMQEKIVSETISWGELSELIKTTIPKKRIKNRPKSKPWWTRECENLKFITVELLKASRGDPQLYTEYRSFKKLYKHAIRWNKKRHNEEEIEELRQIKNISAAWKYINNNRRNQAGPQGRPKDKDLEQHFFKLLEGSMDEPLQSATAATTNLAEEHYITDEELEQHIQKLKRNKAAGPDGIKAEAIRALDERSKRAIKNIMNKCLGGNPIPKEWREARIFTIHKKGDSKVASNYRGIAIGNISYKLYAKILNSRLEEYVEENHLLPDTQNGFRRHRSTIDNIYILNHLANRAIQMGQGLFCAFIDFKAAFDGIDRSLLMKRLTKLAVPEYIVDAISKIYTETATTVLSKTFFQLKGLRQGCPLSPLLFALYIADLDRVLANQQCGGVVVAKKSKIHCLAYADDLVLISSTAEELQSMIKTLLKYAQKRSLTVNVEKSKIMKFSAGGRTSRIVWKYGDDSFEEVKTFQYLGFMFQSNGKLKAHIEHQTSAAKRAISETWSIAERRWTNNFPIRKQMFQSLVVPTMTYGCEVTGFAERDNIEAQARKYFRWTLGLGQGTRKAVLMEEAALTPIWIDTGTRAMRYEEKIAVSPCKILQHCLSEVHRGIACNQWTREREEYCRKGGLAGETVAALLREGEVVSNKLRHTQLCAFQQLQWVTINKLRYASIRPLGTPYYLRHCHKIKLIARFRCENEEWGRDRWRPERRCRICRVAEETLEHQAETCARHLIGGGVEDFLNERGLYWREMEKLIELRCTY